MAQTFNRTAERSAGISWRSAIRVVTAGSLVFVLVVVFLWARMTANDGVAQFTSTGTRLATEAEPSAVQVIQVYAEAAVYALTAIGIAFGAYIGSRAGE